MAIPSTYILVNGWPRLVDALYYSVLYFRCYNVLYCIILYYIILYHIILYYSVLYYPIRQCTVFCVAIGWPPHSHAPHIFKVERVATHPLVRFERGWSPPPLIKGCGYPQLPVFLEKGWPPPPRIVLQCSIP